MMSDDYEDYDVLFPRKLHSGFDDPDREEDGFRYMDLRKGKAYPLFHDEFWPLSAIVRWIQERTQEAVDGWTVDETYLEEVLGAILQALRSGEIRAHGRAGPDPTLREIPRATWFAYVIGFELRAGLIHLRVFRDGAEQPDFSLTEIRVRRDEVLRRWPAPGEKPVQASTAGAEHECNAWLIAAMRASPDQPRPKSEMRAEALQRFRHLSHRGFDRAWSAAVSTTAGAAWSRPGRRPR